MHEPSPLELLTSEFAAWRNNRRSSTEATPAALKQRAVQLRSSHRVSHISRALGVSYSTLKRWADQHCTPAVTDFVALPNAPAPSDASAAGAHGAHEVLCDLPNGVRLTLSSQALSQTLLSTLAQLGSGASS